MMNEMTVFKNEQFGSIRTITKDGEPWFVAADVCRVLELEQIHKALNRLDADEIGRGIEIPHPQNVTKTIEVNIVNESGLYSLILGSRKPEAKAFKRWITHEVIPSIRKTGSYSVQPNNAITIDQNVISMIVGECMKQMLPYIQRPIEISTEATVKRIEAPLDDKHPNYEPRKNGIGKRIPDYGMKLTKQMQKRNVDIKQLAEAINVSRQTVYGWIIGVNYPTSVNFVKVNVALNWRLKV